MDPLQQAKVEAICVILALALIFGMLPIKVRKLLMEQTRIPQKHTLIILSSCLCFGAGVLLATTFLHMLPENQAHFEKLIEDGLVTMVNYPLSELILCLGFLFIYLTEELVHLWVHKHPIAGHNHYSCSMHHNNGYEDGQTIDSTNLNSNSVFPNSHNLTSTNGQITFNYHKHNTEVSHQHDPGHSHQHHQGHLHQHHLGHSHQHHGHSHQHHCIEKMLTKDPRYSKSGSIRELEPSNLNLHIPQADSLVNYQQCFCDNVHSSSVMQDVEKCAIGSSYCCQRSNDLEALVPQMECLSQCELLQNLPAFHQSKKRCESSTTVAIITGCLDQQPSTICVQTNEDFSAVALNQENILDADKLSVATSKGTLVRSVLVVLALSFHGTFEGLALGLERTIPSVWIFCLAICLHKVFIAFSIGMELLELNINFKLYVLHMVVFSMSSPLGATIGTILYAAIKESSSVGLTTLTVLEGLSAGTILYVTFCEVLERERTKVDGRFFKYLALVLGFGIMAALFAIQEP